MGSSVIFVGGIVAKELRNTSELKSKWSIIQKFQVEIFFFFGELLQQNIEKTIYMFKYCVYMYKQKDFHFRKRNTTNYKIC